MAGRNRIFVILHNISMKHSKTPFDEEKWNKINKFYDKYFI